MMSVHWAYKWSAFAASVFALSLFFAGHRQVNETGGVADWALLAGGVVLTACLLLLQGYWIYFEEKAKGTLKKRIGLFENIHSQLEARRNKSNSTSLESDERGAGKK